MASINELVRNLSKKHRDRVEKSKKIAENMIRNAEAAKAAVPKK